MASHTTVGPDLNIAPATFVELLRQRARVQPDRVAYTFLTDRKTKQERITYAELDLRARAIAAYLQNIGAVGQRALLLYPPGLDYIAGFLGCLYAGVVAVPAYPPNPAQLKRTLPRLQAIVQDAQATVALTTKQILSMVSLLKVQAKVTDSFDKVALVRKALEIFKPVREPSLDTKGLSALHWLATDTLEPGLEDDWKEPDIRSDTLAFLQYTSGSTGSPRGVMLSHAHLLYNSALIRTGFEMTPDCEGVIWLPMYHDMGLIGGVLQPLYVGCHCTLMSPLAFLQWPLRWLTAISAIKGKPVVSGGPNFAYDLCVRKTTPEQRERLDLSNWSLAFSGAEPVRQDTMDRFTEAFAPCGFRREAFYPCYGLAEATLFVSGGKKNEPPVVCHIKKQDLQENRVVDASPEGEDGIQLVGCGRELLEQKIVIVDPETHTRCQPNQVGEIWVSSPSVAEGYWRRPEETAQTFRAYVADTGEGPFLRTGDLGFMRDGELYITGRSKDLIIIRGRNHYPQDIERTVETSHELLRPGCGAAFSVDLDGEEQLVIVHEVRRTKKVDFDRVIATIRQAVAEVHELQVQTVVLIKPRTIPKTSSGKIQRFACRKAFLDGKLAVVKEWKFAGGRPTIEVQTSSMPSETEMEGADHGPTSAGAAAIEAWLVSRLSGLLGLDPAEIDIRQPFASYGLDSAQSVSLAGELETWLGRTLPPTLVWDYPTIEALARHLASEAGETAPVRKPQKESRPDEAEPIAIIGMGCRFPGAEDLQAFWRLLRNGGNSIVEVPADRWDVDEFYDPTPGKPGKMVTRWGGFLEHVDRFDPQFFGISPREASRIDPQQRLLMEVAWEALEDAGQTAEGLSSSLTGVFIGISSNDYARLQIGDYEHINAYSGTGNALSIAANRLSYLLDLRGPSVAIDSACSSSLVAVHYACQSLRAGECDMAIVGGVNLILTPDVTINFSIAGVMSPDGQCKAFDSRANGYVRGEGAGVVVLKPLSKAVADGDPIYAVIRGSAVNSDGRSNGLMAPNRQAQEAVLREAYREAGVAPGKVQYVEAHGTGTSLGDPIEVQALGAVLSDGRPQDLRCSLGSVKTNIGHLEAAAGIAGLIKTALAIKHRQLPPSLHFEKPNPLIPFDELPLNVQKSLGPWPAEDKPLIAGVTALGFGGTNCHVVLEEPPAQREDTDRDADTERSFLLPLSAHTSDALHDLARSYHTLFQQNGSLPSLRDICYTASLRRTHRDYRLALTGHSQAEFCELLDAFLRGDPRQGVVAGQRLSGGPRKVVFVFPGQGAQWWGMGHELFRSERVFRESIEQCADVLGRYTDWSLVDRFTTAKEDPLLNRIDVIQPTLFALQVALAALWRSWGIDPDAVVGHSMGEVAAAHVAGILSLEDAVRVIFHRSRLLRTVAGRGAMAAVELSLEEAREALNGYEDRLSVAVHAGPKSTVLSGDPEALRKVLQTLERRDVFCRLLKVDVASHSPQVVPLQKELVEVLRDVQPCAGDLPIFSTVTGEIVNGEEFGADYWGRNLRQPVLFSAAVSEAVRSDHHFFLELNAHPILSGAIRGVLSELGAEGVSLPSLRREEEERAVMLSSLGALYANGFHVEWARLYPDGGRCVSLPTIPWQRERYWFDSDREKQVASRRPASADERRNGVQKHPLLGRPQRSALLPGKYLWQNRLDLKALPYLEHHRLQDSIVFPATGYLEMALAAASEVLSESATVLEEVSFQRALYLLSEQPHTVQVALSPVAGGRARFQVFSLAEGEDPQNGTWALHSSGTISTDNGNGLMADSRVGSSLDAIRSRCTQEVSAARHYEFLRQLGLSYGPMFQGVVALWTGDQEALGYVQLPQPIEPEAERYRLHPALLDGCLQVIAAAVPATGAAGMHDPFMPVHVKRVRLHRRPGSALWSYVKLRTTEGKESSDGLEADLFLFDDEGNLTAELQAVRLQRLPRDRGEAVQNLLYRVEWSPSPLAEASAQEIRAAASGTWLLFTDGNGLSQGLASELSRYGARCVSVEPADTYESLGVDHYRVNPSRVEDFERLIADLIGSDRPRLQGIVHLWAADQTIADDSDVASLEKAQSLITGSALHLIQALAKSQMKQSPRLYFVTRGAQSVNADSEQLCPAQSTLWGLARVVALEHPELHCKAIDLDPRSGSEEVKSLLREVARADPEDQVAYRSSRRYAPRLTSYSVTKESQEAESAIRTESRLELPNTEAFHLVITVPGRLDRLELESVDRRRPLAGEVEIEVDAAGLNFRDVMSAMGLYPDGPIPLGGECAGRISAVGEHVDGLHVGDEVLAIAPSSLGSFATTLADLVVPKPAVLTSEEAATIPIAFLTAYYALHHLARLGEGERVLIHSAAGGVGLAAVQVARMLGAEVLATAGSPERREYLSSIGVKHVMDSHSLAFADEVLELTGGTGVDVVLNSLSGEAISRNLAVLADYGRYLEIGKTDIYQNSQLDLFPFRKNLSFFAIDIGRLCHDRPKLARSLLLEVVRYLENRRLQPLPARVFPLQDAVAAFRHMVQRKNIGKIVLSVKDRHQEKVVRRHEHLLVRSDATYLITGGMGALGLLFARWLAEKGARHLVLVGRSAPGDTAQQEIDSLRRAGMEVKIAQADVAVEEEMQAVFAEVADTMPPLRGVIHAAGVLDDGVLLQLNPRRFEKVMRPKVSGAWNLYRLTLSSELDFFVLFSSAASVFGSPGQGNYAAASSFLDALAHYCRAHGRAALAVNWGPWAEVGLAARPNRGGRLALRGFDSIDPQRGVQVLDWLLHHDASQAVVAPIDWPQLLDSLPASRLPALLAGFADRRSSSGRQGGVSEPKGRLTKEELLTASPEERSARLHSYLRSQIARVIGVAPSKLADERPLNTFGLDSLMAIELKNTIEANLGVALPVASLLRGPTLSQLTDQLVAQIAEPSPTPTPSEVSEKKGVREHPLSHGQKAMWFQHQIAPSSIYNVVYAVRIRSELDLDSLRRAFQTLVKRHAALRTTFTSRNGEPVQLIHEQMEVDFHHEDAADWSSAQLSQRLDEETHRPFNLESGPLMRVFVFSRSPSEHVLLLVAHHIVMDMWSQAVLLQELSVLYSSANDDAVLPPLRLEYTDYVRQQEELLNGPEGERLWSYWQGKLKKELPVLNLPTDRPRPPVQGYKGASQSIRLDAELTSRVKALSERQGTTLFVTLLAAFKALLHRYSGQTDMIVGSPTTGRSRAELAGLVGYFVNPVALRSSLSPDRPFVEFLSQVRQTVLEALEHQDYPFSLLVERLQPQRDPSRTPLFQVMFMLQKAYLLADQGFSSFALGQEGAHMDLGGLPIESVALEQRVAPFDLTLMMAEVDGELAASLVYNVDLYEPETAQRILRHYCTLLRSAVENPEQPVGRLTLLSEEEQRQILVDWNQTGTQYPSDRCIHQLFEERVRKSPEATAVVLDEQQLSYRELNERANQLARHLQKMGVGPEVLVGLCMERSVDMIVSVLGVLKAGGAYVPIDPTYPSERLAFMLQDAAVSVVITHDKIAGQIPHNGARVLRIDSDWPEIAVEERSNLPCSATPQNLAYVIYTSGSTGRPKGVMLQHSGLCNMTRSLIKNHRIDAHSRVLQFASFSFDASVEEIFTALVSGAALCLARQETLASGPELIRLLQEQEITTVTLTPSVLSVLPEADLPELKTIISAGEACTAEIAERWSRGRYFINAYGPTESTVCASFYPVEKVPESGSVPIGRPIDNTQLYILDERLNPVPPGVSGELYVGGVGLARGYLSRPDLTADRFIPHPFSDEPGARLYRTGDLARYLPDGTIEFLGRIDQQVKIRGFRIELGEIEALLKRHPAVEEAAVLADRERNQLYAYYTPAKIPAAGCQRIELWPSVAEFFIYDDLLYFAMTHDELRNEKYRAAIERHAKDKIVLDLGTGKDAILARMCVEAGARKVYAIEILEESYRKAKALIEDLGLADKIHLIHGDSTQVQLPEKVDVCVSEIVGAIGGSEGGAKILNDARRFLKEGGIMIPVRSVTRIAAVTLPDDFLANPTFTDVTGHYVEQIFEHVGHKFDLRLCLKGLAPSDLISNADVFEDLDFSHEVTPEYTREVNFTITRDGRIDGFVVWLTLQTVPDQVIDILAHEHCWLPVYFPVFYPGVRVSKGDTIRARVTGTLCENGLNPDYRIEGTLIRKKGDPVHFEHNSYHYKNVFRQTPFYDRLFSGDVLPVADSSRRQVPPSELKEYLREYLPEYMVPSSIVKLDTFPLTPSGKVDRNALPNPRKQAFEKNGPYLVPQSDKERAIADIWQEVLHVDRVGLNDNFFDLGGHSLNLVQVQGKVKEVFDKEISVVDMFKYPTVSALARYLSQKDGHQPSFARTHDRARKQREALSQRRERMRSEKGVQ